MKIDKKKIILVLAILTIALLIIISSISKKNDTSNDFSFNDVTKENTTEIIKEEASKIEKIKIHIAGEVNSPGLIELESGARIADAIELAGGLTENADISKTNLAYILSDGEKIYIPNFNDDISTDNEQSLNSSSKININTGNLDELQKIPRSWRIYSKFYIRV